jgi:hypothetical protein
VGIRGGDVGPQEVAPVGIVLLFAPPLLEGYGIPAVRTGRPDELAVAAKEVFGAATGPQVIIAHARPAFPGRSWGESH